MAHFGIFVVVLALFGCNVGADICSEKDMMACISGLMGDSSLLDAKTICAAFDCIDNLENTCELSEEMKSMLDSQTNSPQMKEALAMCKGSGDKGGCSIISIEGCGIDFSKMSSQPNLTAMCGAKGCLEAMLPQCVDDMKNTVQSIVTGLKAACADGCSINDLQKCGMYVKDVQHKDHMKTCRASKEAAKCFKDLMPKCPEEMKKNIEKSLKEMEPIVTGDCCEKLVMIGMECANNATALENFSPKIGSCKMMEDSFTCMMKFKTNSCKGVMKTSYDEIKEGMVKSLDKCNKKGYNITVDYQEGRDTGSGMNLQPTAAILLSVCMMVLGSFWF